MEHYKLLGIIFNRSTATGILRHSSTQDPPNTQEEYYLEHEYLNSGVHVDLDDDDNDDASAQNFERDTCRRKHTYEIAEHKRKNESGKFQIGDALQAWAEASKARAEVQRAKVERYKARGENASEVTSNDYTISKCIAVLDEIEGVSDDHYVKALEKFTEVKYREIFMSIPIARKKAWLETLL